MAAFSDYLENALASFIFKNNAAAFATPGDSIFIALSTADPLDDGSGIAEPVGNGYARQQVAAAGWSQTGGAVENTAEIAFPAASGGAWGAITHVAIFDAVTAGNMLFHGALTASKTINDTDQFKFNAGDLDITLA